jgi:hypothetical protein
MLDSKLVGNEHLTQPFTIGQIDVDRGFVHIFDDTTLDIVLGTLDTISDFTHYPMEKERAHINLQSAPCQPFPTRPDCPLVQYRFIAFLVIIDSCFSNDDLPYRKSLAHLRF